VATCSVFAYSLYCILCLVLLCSCADLQLAAELGKALLERNVDLEAQLHNLQQTSSEQESEITVR